MNLSEKPCYPLSLTTIDGQAMDNVDYDKSKETSGITFRERLVVAGFGNPKFFSDKGSMYINNEEKPFLLLQVDRLIKEMEK